MSFPILLRDVILGTLTIGSVNANEYRSVETKGLQLLAQQLGVIIDRVNLFKKVTEDAEFIRNLLDSIDTIVYTIDREYRILEGNRAWNNFLQAYGEAAPQEYRGMNIFDILPDERLKILLHSVLGDLFAGSVRYFSREIVLQSTYGERVYQVTINPIISEKVITGLVINHADITDVKRTASELKKYSEQLLMLNSIASFIQASKSKSEILNHTIPQLQRMIDADGLITFLKESDSDILTLSAHSIIQPSYLERIPQISLTTTITGEVLRSRKPLFIQRRVAHDPRVLPVFRELFQTAGVEALAILPLATYNQIFGALFILYRKEKPFTDQVIQILSLACNQLGTALENVELYSQLQTQVQQLSVMYQIGQQLTSTLEIERVFEIVVENLQKIIPFDRLTIEMLNPERSELTSWYDVTQLHGVVQMFSNQPETKPIEPSSPEWQTIRNKSAFAVESGNKLLVPMLSKERIIGILTIIDRQVTRYSESQVQMLESVANLMAIALEKGKLYQETINKTMEIERRNKELNDFTYVVSHDLKEPLISIEGFSRILEADYGTTIPEDGKEFMDSIVAASGRMKNLIDDLLMLSRVSRPGEAFKPVPLQEVVDEIKADIEFSLLKKNAVFTVENALPVIIGNRAHLKILFQNLISNALKFNKKDQPHIEIGFQNSENNAYLFYVRDDGIGIEKDFQEKIFVIFQRLHRREEYEGTGAGLAIVRKIVEIHKGTIWVESEPGLGSTFYFTLPK